MASTSEELGPEAKKDARHIFEGKVDGVSACWHCGGYHGHVARLATYAQPCPRIKRVVRDGDGKPTEVEYWPPGQWEKGIIFPEDVFDEDDE